MGLTREHNSIHSLAVQGTEVARYQSGTGLGGQQSPRPFLHPIRTLTGTMVSDAEPPDHPHHLGLSLAVSDAGGSNFWGGRTFTADRGSVMLPNHGRQLVSSSRSGAGSVSESIDWCSADGSVEVTERRHLSVSGHPDRRCWSLSFTSRLMPGPSLEHLALSSSAVKGREGAGYGGIFWRLPRNSRAAVVLTESGSGIESAHGSASPWLSITAVVAGKTASIMLAQDAQEPLPWFVRTDGYLGAGPAVAWDSACRLDRSQPLDLSLHAVVMDGPVETPELARSLLAQHPAFTATSLFDRTA
ncbi:PmoA family protein [Arthrobacter sp. ISL-30]|uniref:DUF6807 domain-containing protein n=1 Tax=Arthrobacter sp. ISL-30 TaxID=2819109 RepID=UPI001BE67FFC|nr:PmoA family protein [Arthrobacter sp. ISL-30]MBT2515023.1 PmoA family protein [Arthrobacter sp. ISL-30]